VPLKKGGGEDTGSGSERDEKRAGMDYDFGGAWLVLCNLPVQ
jgi:hypothetical protein